MSYARLPRGPRLAGLGGEAWVLPNPLTKPGVCWARPIKSQVMIHPGENTWLVSNKSHAPLQAGPSSAGLLSERIRAMLNFNGIAVQSITFSEGAYNSVLTPGGAKYTGTATTDCAACNKPVYATVKFTYTSSGPLFVIWPIWNILDGYCEPESPAVIEGEAGPSLLLLETAGPKGSSGPGTPAKPPATKPPVGPTTPTQPGTSPNLPAPPATAANPYLLPALLAGVALVGVYVFTRKPSA